MAGIFNLFGDISTPDRGLAVKPLSRSKSSLATNSGSLKNAGQSKPKGLSIRSNSDLNVPAAVQITSNKQDHLSLKLVQLDVNGCPISPKKGLSLKKSSGSCSRIKDVSPKKALNKKNIKSPKSSDEVVFKKPIPMKDYAKKMYPEPERLASYHDMQFEFDDVYTQKIANEFKELLMAKRNEVMPYQDEGFESDAEKIDVEMPIFRTSPNLYESGRAQCKTPELPEISDLEDNF